MKRRNIYALMAVVFAIVIIATPAMAEEQVYDYFKMVKLVIGEKEAIVNSTPTTMDQSAYVKNGRTLVPFRFLGESLGAEILWDGATNQATLKLGDTEVDVIIGSKVAYIDGEMTELDVAAETKGGRTFIPLRFVSEALGAYVDYDQATAMVTVRYIDTTNWKEYIEPSTEWYYGYPADWTVTTEQNDTITCFTSPRGSKLWIYASELSPQDLSAAIKKTAVEKGFTLDTEELADSEDPNEGMYLVFSKFDNEINDYLMEYISIDPRYDAPGSYVTDEFMQLTDVEVDGIITNEIIWS